MTAPQIHNVQQRSEAWHALRARHFCASEAPAMMGASQFKTRAELLRAKAHGIEREIDAATERLFWYGHEAEESSRPSAEKMLGEELFPVVLTREVEGLPLLASLDGMTIDGSKLWEHKLYSPVAVKHIDETGEPPPQYYWQLEHQLLVSGAQSAMLTMSDSDGRSATCWYESNPERRAALIAGWRQFAADLEAARRQTPQQQAADEAQARPIAGFGALVLRVEGRVLASNLDAFRAGAQAFLDRLPKAGELQTDQDFSDAEQAVKACLEAEDRIRAAKEQAIAQMADVDAVLRTADEIAESIRAARLALDKAVKARKDAIRAELVRSAADAVLAHYAAIESELHEYAPRPPATLAAELGATIKGLKTVASIRDRLDQAVAQHKIEADAIARRVGSNAAIIRDAIDWHGNLWPDAPRLCRELSEEALRGVIAARVDEWQKREQERAAAAQAQRVASQPHATAVPTQQAPTAEPLQLKLADINALIAPMRIDADGLAALGVRATRRGGAARLFDAREVRAALQRYAVALARQLDTI